MTVACAAALAPLAALAVMASPSETAVTAAATVPRCSTSGLVVWLNTQGNGTAGSIYYTLELTNLSGRTCTLLGYPGVSAVTLGGAQLGSAAGRYNTGKVTAVTLGTGATATASLQIVEAGNFPPATCRMVTASGLRVYPPNQTVSKVIPFPFQSCSRSGPIYLRVQTVRKA
jgi:hypothetical protein